MNEIPNKPIQVKIFFATLDKNHDGVITLEEITAMIKERQKQGGGRGLGFRRSGGVRGDRAAEPSKPADKKDAAHSKDQASAK
jgi:hypothetical protein